MLRLLLALALCAVASTLPCRADSANVAGLGTMACSEAEETLKQPAYRTSLTSWAVGFMSGANVVMTARDKAYRDLSNLNADLILGSVQAFCGENPSGVILQGVERLYAGRPTRVWTDRR